MSAVTARGQSYKIIIIVYIWHLIGGMWVCLESPGEYDQGAIRYRRGGKYCEYIGRSGGSQTGRERVHGVTKSWNY